MANQIPVYGLSGIDGAEAARSVYNSLGGCSLGAPSRPRYTGEAFNRYANTIKNPAYRQAVIKRHNQEISALNGVFDVSYRRVASGNGTNADNVFIKKAKILITLANTDYHGYRIAQVVMPYAVDIDDSGAYYFPSYELAKAAAEGEEKIIDYLNTPGASEVGFEEQLGSFKSFLKKVGNAVGKATKAVGKAVVNSVTAPVKATIQATKAAFNVTKAGIQTITGNKAAAKESLQKAGEAAKSAIVDPVKTAYKDTADVIKTNIVEPTKLAYEVTKDITKGTIQIAGKVFKVLFLKINPLTVLTRSALRSLLAINFIGLATRLNVGLLTQEQAASLGYDADTWEKAKKALKGVKKLFEKMGGNVSKLLKSITNGAGKKPLFAKDIRPDTKVNAATNDDEEATLGMDPATIAGLLALTSTIITVIWEKVKQVTVRKQELADRAYNEQKHKEAEAKIQEQKEQMEATYAHNNQGQFFTDEYGNLITWEQWEQIQDEATTDPDSDTKKKILIAAGVGLALVGGVLIYKNRKK